LRKALELFVASAKATGVIKKARAQQPSPRMIALQPPLVHVEEEPTHMRSIPMFQSFGDTQVQPNERPRQGANDTMDSNQLSRASGQPDARASQGQVIDPTKLVAKPKRALTAYNLFFKIERERVLAGNDSPSLPVSREDLVRIRKEHKTNPKRKHRKSHGKVGFQELNRIVSNRWKNLPESEKFIFVEQAGLEKQEYIRKLRDWEAQEKATGSASHFLVRRASAASESNTSGDESIGDMSFGEMTLNSGEKESQSNLSWPSPVLSSLRPGGVEGGLADYTDPLSMNKGKSRRNDSDGTEPLPFDSSTEIGYESLEGSRPTRRALSDYTDSVASSAAATTAAAAREQSCRDPVRRTLSDIVEPVPFRDGHAPLSASFSFSTARQDNLWASMPNLTGSISTWNPAPASSLDHVPLALTNEVTSQPETAESFGNDISAPMNAEEMDSLFD